MQVPKAQMLKDVQTPFCSTFGGLRPEILQSFPKMELKITSFRWSWKHYPLSIFQGVDLRSCASLHSYLQCFITTFFCWAILGRRGEGRDLQNRLVTPVAHIWSAQLERHLTGVQATGPLYALKIKIHVLHTQNHWSLLKKEIPAWDLDYSHKRKSQVNCSPNSLVFLLMPVPNE